MTRPAIILAYSTAAIALTVAVGFGLSLVVSTPVAIVGAWLASAFIVLACAAAASRFLDEEPLTIEEMLSDDLNWDYIEQQRNRL